MRYRLALLLLVAVSVAIVRWFGWDYVAGDPLAYRDRTAAIIGGEIPYAQGEMEHLPVMLAPMVVTWFAGGFLSPPTYRAIWVLITTGALLGVMWGMSQLGDSDGEVAAIRRWLAIVWPLIPIVVFRNDPWVVLPIVLAFAATRRRTTGVTIGYLVTGVLAKGWPLVTVPVMWRVLREKRILVAGALAAAGVALVAATPGFGSGRAFRGLHTESLGGAIWLISHSRAEPVTLFGDAGATYVDAPLWLALPGAITGLALMALAFRRLRQSDVEWRSVLALTAVLVIAVLLMSPLQSAQFLLWPSVFLAFVNDRTAHVAFAGAAIFALATLVGFDSLANNQAWWSTAVILRHVALTGSALATLLFLRPATSSTASTAGP